MAISKCIEKKLQESRYRQAYILAASGQLRELSARGCIYVPHSSTNLTFMNLFLNLFIIQTTTLFSDNLFYNLIPAVWKNTAFCLFWSFYLLILLSTFTLQKYFSQNRTLHLIDRKDLCESVNFVFSPVNAKNPYGYLEYLSSINTNAWFPSAFLIIFNDCDIIGSTADALKRIIVCISLQTPPFIPQSYYLVFILIVIFYCFLSNK